MSLMEAGKLKYTVRIERPPASSSFDDAGSDAWSLVATVAAEIQDMLPSRGERLADGLNVATRPARVRIWWRSDVTAAMRIVRGTRTMQIVTPPAEIDDGRGLEFMVEDYSTAGGGA